MSIQLLEPILKGGIHNTHFFNGRLLTAEALHTDQGANRQQHQRLGQAIGAGVVHGLQVEKSVPGASPPGSMASMVKVSAGLALNRKGQTLYLPHDTEVSLVHEKSTDDSAGLFVECEDRGTMTATNLSAYILVLSPASGFRERAPMSGLGTNGKVTGCGNRYAIEGVKFRLVKLELTLTGVSDNARRNVIAHRCFGTDVLTEVYRDPFQQVDRRSSFGALDKLRSQELLDDCDVPLALIYWGTNQIEFVDMWSVRRRPTPMLPSEVWPHFVGERRPAEGEAVFLQFQNQLADLIRPNLSLRTASSIVATNYFHYLPPAGLLPVSQGTAGGLNLTTFLTNIPHHDSPTFIDGAQINALLRESFNHDPITVYNPTNPTNRFTGEMVRIYKVRQNEAAIVAGQSVQPYVVFATGHIPPIDAARFDVARWDYSNFA